MDTTAFVAAITANTEAVVSLESTLALTVGVLSVLIGILLVGGLLWRRLF